MTATQLILATVLMAVGACVQGSVGFGMGLMTAPLLTLIDPAYVPAPVLMASMPLSAMVAVRERRSLDYRGLGWAFAGRVPGTVAGVAAVALLPDTEMAVLFGVVVLTAVVLTWAGWYFRPTPRTLVTAGVASGFMGTATSIGGPPIALVYQHEEGPRLRSTLATFFVLGATFSIVSLAVGGEVDGHSVALGLSLLPGMLLGFVLSGPVTRHLDRGHTRTAVLVLSATAAVAVIVKEVVG